MQPFDDDSDLEAQLRSLRPLPRPEFQNRLDERVASGFPRWPRFSALISRIARRASDHLGSAAAWTLRRSARAVEAAGMEKVSLRSAMVWSSVIASGLALGAGVSTIQSISAGSPPAYGLSSRDTVRAAVEMSGTRIASNRFADRRFQPGFQRSDADNPACLRFEPRTGGVDATVATVAEIAHASGGIVDRLILREGKANASTIIEMRIPNVPLNAILSRLSAVGEVRSRSDSLRSRGRVSRVLVWIVIPPSASTEHQEGPLGSLADIPRTLNGAFAIGLVLLIRLALAWMFARPPVARRGRGRFRRVPAEVR